MSRRTPVDGVDEKRRRKHDHDDEWRRSQPAPGGRPGYATARLSQATGTLTDRPGRVTENLEDVATIPASFRSSVIPGGGWPAVRHR